MEDNLHIGQCSSKDSHPSAESSAQSGTKENTSGDAMEGCVKYNATCISTVYCLGEVTCLEWIQQEQHDQHDHHEHQQQIMFGTTQGEIKVWDVYTMSCVNEFRAKSTHPIVTDVCHSARHHVAALSSIAPTTSSMSSSSSSSSSSNRSTLSSVQLWSLEHHSGVNHELINDGDSGRVTKIVMNRRGNLLATGSDDGRVRLYDIETKKKLIDFEAHNDGVGGVLFHGDNDAVLVTCGSVDGNILDWDIRDMSVGPAVVRRYTGAPRINDPRMGRGGSDERMDMRYDPTKTFLLTGSRKNGAGMLYKTMKKSPIQMLENHLAPVVAVDWMPWKMKHQSISHALTGSLDGSLCIWTLKTK
jgi:WD40 repeat protein